MKKATHTLCKVRGLDRVASSRLAIHQSISNSQSPEAGGSKESRNLVQGGKAGEIFFRSLLEGAIIPSPRVERLMCGILARVIDYRVSVAFSRE